MATPRRILRAVCVPWTADHPPGMMLRRFLSHQLPKAVMALKRGTLYRKPVHCGPCKNRKKPATSDGRRSSMSSIVGKNLPGTRNEEFFAWESKGAAAIKAADAGGPFQVEQLIQRLLRADPMALTKIYTVPEDQDTYLWQYEHLRQMMKELNMLVARLDGTCTRESCPVMKATDDWVFLCAAHKAPKECCAFEYIVHTMDNVNTLLTSSRVFPSRVSVTSNATQYFQSVARRLYRIFSHTYFHHPEIFREFEDDTNLCHRFVFFAIHFCLIPKNLLIIPDMQ